MLFGIIKIQAWISISKMDGKCARLRCHTSENRWGILLLSDVVDFRETCDPALESPVCTRFDLNNATHLIIYLLRTTKEFNQSLLLM